MATRVRLTGMNLNEAVDLAKDLGCSVIQPSANGEFFVRHPSTGPRPCVVNSRRTDAPRHLTQMLKRLLREQRPAEPAEEDEVDAADSTRHPWGRPTAAERRDRMVVDSLAERGVFLAIESVEANVRAYHPDLAERSEVSFFYSDPTGAETNFRRVRDGDCEAYFYGVQNPAGDGFSRWVAIDAPAFRDWWRLTGEASNRWVRTNNDGSQRLTIPLRDLPDGIVLARYDAGPVPLPADPKPTTQPLFPSPLMMPEPKAAVVASPAPADPLGRFKALREEMLAAARGAIDGLLAKRSNRINAVELATVKLAEAKAAVAAADDEIAKLRDECEALGVPVGRRVTSPPAVVAEPTVEEQQSDRDRVMEMLNRNRGTWVSAEKIMDSVRPRRPVCYVIADEIASGAVGSSGERRGRSYRVA